MASKEALLQQIEFLNIRIEALEAENKRLHSNMEKAKSLLQEFVDEASKIEVINSETVKS